MSAKLASFVETNFNCRTILKTFNSFENIITSNYIIYHNSFDSYCNDEKTPFKRLLVYPFFWILNLIYLIELAILIISPDQMTKGKIIMPVILPADQRKFIYMILFLLSLIILLGRIIMMTFEKYRRVHIWTLFHNWQTQSGLFGLNHHNTNKLIIQSQLFYWIGTFIKLFVIAIIYIYTLYNAILAYIDHNYHLAGLTIHLLTFLIFVVNSINFIFVGLYFEFTV